jgi:hypothetical protein
VATMRKKYKLILKNIFNEPYLEKFNLSVPDEGTTPQVLIIGIPNAAKNKMTTRSPRSLMLVRVRKHL